MKKKQHVVFTQGVRKEPWTMGTAVEMAVDVRIPEIASCCEVCPAALLCNTASEQNHQVTDCGIPLHDDLVHVFLVYLTEKIARMHQSA